MFYHVSLISSCMISFSFSIWRWAFVYVFINFRSRWNMKFFYIRVTLDPSCLTLWGRSFTRKWKELVPENMDLWLLWLQLTTSDLVWFKLVKDSSCILLNTKPSCSVLSKERFWTLLWSKWTKLECSLRLDHFLALFLIIRSQPTCNSVPTAILPATNPKTKTSSLLPKTRSA